MEYVQLLNEKSADITLPLASVCSCKVTARVKAQNSIEFKIQNYKTERHEFGKIPINKCINDLFGIRIFLREPLTFDEVYSFIEDTYPNRYRCIDSSKFDYKAVHLYFKENNQSFPWELQIWNMCDMDSNVPSVNLMGAFDADKTLGIVSFVVEGYQSDEVGTILDDEYDIAVRTGYHCAPYIHDYLGDKPYHGTIRIGIGQFNTKEDIDALIKALESL